MSTATITALITGIPAILGAITALIIALKAHGHATSAQATANHAVGDAHAITAALFGPAPTKPPAAP
jgi:hypothetical protein